MKDSEKKIEELFDIEENFSIPDNYFDDFEARMAAKIADIEQEQTVDSTPLHTKKDKKYMPLTWITTSCAAAVAGLLIGIFVFNTNTTTSPSIDNTLQANTENTEIYYDEIVDYYDAVQIEEFLALTEYPTEYPPFE